MVEYGRGIMLKVDAATRSLDLEDVEYTLPPDLVEDGQHEETCKDEGKVSGDVVQQQQQQQQVSKRDEIQGKASGGGGSGGGGGGGGSAVSVPDATVDLELDLQVAVAEVAQMTAAEKDLWLQLEAEKARAEALEVQVESLQQQIKEYEQLIMTLIATLALIAVRDYLVCW